jgi:hypothetical protein
MPYAVLQTEFQPSEVHLALNHNFHHQILRPMRLVNTISPGTNIIP